MLQGEKSKAWFSKLDYPAQKFLLIGGQASSLVNFRGSLLRAFVAKGAVVTAAAPNLALSSTTGKSLDEMGVAPYEFAMSRTGLNPVADLGFAISLYRLMRIVRPDIVLSYTIKPVIWGTLMAWLAGVPKRYALITGLGYAFTGRATGKRLIVQRIARRLYKIALSRATKVFFQNIDDATLFRNLGLVPENVPIVVVYGSGVDLLHFSVVPLPDGLTSFLMIARILGDKGVREYVQAARLVRQRNPGICFHLVGGLDANPDSIKFEEIDSWQTSGDVIWHGMLDDVRPAIAASHVYVLPSYREGTPRSVLEAMSMGRAVITTDAPGCRETVVEGENGYLVPIKDVKALASAMQRFIDDRALIVAMGQSGRQLAENKYDVHKVNAKMMDEMGL